MLEYNKKKKGKELFHHPEIGQYTTRSYDIKHNKRSITILFRYDLRRCN